MKHYAIKPGDFIVAYHKGIHRVLEVREAPHDDAVWVRYQRVNFAQKDLEPHINECSIMYCRSAEVDLADRIEELSTQLRVVQELTDRFASSPE